VLEGPSPSRICSQNQYVIFFHSQYSREHCLNAYHRPQRDIKSLTKQRLSECNFPAFHTILEVRLATHFHPKQRTPVAQQGTAKLISRILNQISLFDWILRPVESLTSLILI